MADGSVDPETQPPRLACRPWTGTHFSGAVTGLSGINPGSPVRDTTAWSRRSGLLPLAVLPVKHLVTVVEVHPPPLDEHQADAVLHHVERVALRDE